MSQKEKGLQTTIESTHVTRINDFGAKVRDTFGVFGVMLETVEVKIFPDGLCFLLRPLEPVRMRVVRSFEDDLRFALGKSKIEIVAPIPDEQLIGVTVFMNVRKEIYGLDEPEGIVSPWTADLQEEVLYEQAKTVVQELQNVSVTILERKFNIGYSRAALLIALLEERGVIGPDDGTGKRDIYPQE